ncbi:hypothetical protein [Actinokineospora enzanensis]|uniref:hypothetical protein n=1 Tax=Actinokineospora enzanensis TaxID=155975 RepID=UPI00037CD255|nr:hypothetical protein [Actinokineospora enzanensis]
MSITPPNRHTLRWPDEKDLARAEAAFVAVAHVGPDDDLILSRVLIGLRRLTWTTCTTPPG